MPDPKKAVLQAVIDHCTLRWTEAEEARRQGRCDADLAECTGKKMAYNDVLQHARQMLAALDAPASAA